MYVIESYELGSTDFNGFIVVVLVFARTWFVWNINSKNLLKIIWEVWNVNEDLKLDWYFLITIVVKDQGTNLDN